MNTNVTGVRWFSLHPCALNEISLSNGRVSFFLLFYNYSSCPNNMNQFQNITHHIKKEKIVYTFKKISPIKFAQYYKCYYTTYLLEITNQGI